MEMDPDYISLLHKEFTHQLNPDEAVRLRTWLGEAERHRQFRLEIRRSWELSRTEVAETEEAEIEAELGRLKQRIHSDPQPKRHILHHGLQARHALIGILLLLILGAGGLFLSQYTPEPPPVVNSYVNDAGEEGVKLFYLPDSSRVFAKAATRLTYQLEGSNRIVRLAGQAFFQVVRDEQHPFLINVEGMRVKVLGTSFFIKAVAGEPLEVSVSTGAVEVHYESEQYHLAKGEMLRISPESGPQLSRNRDANYLSWQHGKLVFQQSPLQEVLPALERHYGVDFEVMNPDLLQCSFTGTFQDAALEDLLEILSYSLKISVERLGQQRLGIKGGVCPEDDL